MRTLTHGHPFPNPIVMPDPSALISSRFDSPAPIRRFKLTPPALRFKAHLPRARSEAITAAASPDGVAIYSSVRVARTPHDRRPLRVLSVRHKFARGKSARDFGDGKAAALESLLVKLLISHERKKKHAIKYGQRGCANCEMSISTENSFLVLSWWGN